MIDGVCTEESIEERWEEVIEESIRKSAESVSDQPFHVDEELLFYLVPGLVLTVEPDLELHIYKDEGSDHFYVDAITKERAARWRAQKASGEQKLIGEA